MHLSPALLVNRGFAQCYQCHLNSSSYFKFVPAKLQLFIETVFPDDTLTVLKWIKDKNCAKIITDLVRDTYCELV